MKTKNLLILAVIFALSSCMPDYFYQVYKVNPDKKIETKSDFLVYEDQYCKIFYNLWEENGNIGFSFYNKTDSYIYLNLDKSFFILNGQAYPYYQNRVFSSSSNLKTTASNSVYVSYFLIGTANSSSSTSYSGSAVSRIERKILTVPSKTSIKIAEFAINYNLIRNCDLYRYPKRKEIKSVSFNKSNSPIEFSNRISYSLENSTELVEIENNFYVSEITNYPENEMYDYKDEEFCGQTNANEIKYSKEQAPNKFYLKYPNGDTYSTLDH